MKTTPHPKLTDAETLQHALSCVLRQIAHDRAELKQAVDIGDEKLAVLWNQEIELKRAVYQRLLSITHAARQQERSQ